jgi:hypothetical protein
LRWRTKIEEFLPYLHYIKGEKNVLADNLSCLHRLPTPATLAKGKKLVEPAEVTDDKGNRDDEAFFLEQQFSGMYLGTKLLHFTLLYSYFTCLTPNFGRDVCRHVR